EGRQVVHRVGEGLRGACQADVVQLGSGGEEVEGAGGAAEFPGLHRLSGSGVDLGHQVGQAVAADAADQQQADVGFAGPDQLRVGVPGGAVDDEDVGVGLGGERADVGSP